MSDNWTRVVALLPALLSSLLGAGCAQVALDHPADAGTTVAPSTPHVVLIDPAPGAIAAVAHFNVTFSAPMDEGQLIASSGQCETVVLVAAADVERAAAALSRPHLTPAERALLLPATPTIALGAESIELVPDAPLPQGSIYLLVANRLRDAAGNRLDGNGARYAFEVAAALPAPVLPQLIAPQPGAEVPANLARVRVQWPDLDGGIVSLIGEGGALVAAAAGDEINLCQGGNCTTLNAGQSYSLALDGVAVPDAGFTVASCMRSSPPALLALGLVTRDDSLRAEILLDWPALVHADAIAAGCDAGCPGGDVLVQCAPPGCGASDAGVVCSATLQLRGLAPSTNYLLRLKAADDEGFELRAPDRPFTTSEPLPHLIVSEVMAYPPAPAPRSPGQYIEILNQGPSAADLGALALIGPDGSVRPLLADPQTRPLLLAAGERALGVGASFEKSRYPSLPQNTPLLFASTQRLLGRGLHEQDPQAFSLVQIQAGGVPATVASFPGNAPSCPVGASLQRDEAMAPEAEASWSCGVVGGTPGAAP